MNLQDLNPKVYEMWRLRKEGGPYYYSPSTAQDVEAIEAEVKTGLPDDYKEFLLEYSTVGVVPKIGANYFKCVYPDETVITFDFSLVPSAPSTLSAIRALHNPHPHFEDVGVRIPEVLLPLALDPGGTLMIDLRQEGFGNILYIGEVKKKTFGTDGYGWNNVGFVSDTFTDFIRDLDTKEVQKKKYKLPVKS